MTRGGSDLDGLLDAFRARSEPALARLVSWVEDERPEGETVLRAIQAQLGVAPRMGITGAPGAGKSTLIDEMVRCYRARDLTVAVVAVDPTSPFTGGALLGDRVRMESQTMDDGVYIRSMATRGAHGGLAVTCREVCDLLDAFGFDRILIETVGVGQSELAVLGVADVTTLVLGPESGDGVQVLKAGVMEVADLYVVNKADRPGADAIVHAIREMLTLPDHVPEGETARVPAVLETVATTGTGVPAVVDHLEMTVEGLNRSGGLERRRRERRRVHARDVIDRAVRRRVWTVERAALDRYLDRAAKEPGSAYDLADTVVADLFRNPAPPG